MTPQEMLDDIYNSGISLTSWEENFCDSLENRLNSNMELTSRQLDKLKDIWNKCVQEED